MNDAPPATRPPLWRSKLNELFGIDPRTLGLFRICLALLLLYNLAGRAEVLRAMYSDEGLIAVNTQQQLLGDDNWNWSLNLLNGSVGFQIFLFTLGFAFAIALLMGWLTRLATIGSWLIVMSLHVRAPILINGGDVLLVMMLLWGIFLPLGRRFSIDALMRGDPLDNHPEVSVASAAALLQVAFMYFFTGLWKWTDPWHQGIAVEYSLSYQLITRPLGDWLLNYPALLSAATYGTLWLELIGPFFFFIPWGTSRFRLITLVAFLSLHVGIELTMNVILFSLASMAALMVLVPREFWESRIIRRAALAMKRLLPNRPRSRRNKPPTKKSKSEANAIFPRIKNFAWYLGQAFCCCGIIFSLAWNIGSVTIENFLYKPPFVMRRIAQVTGMSQTWNMFFRPNGEDVWLVGRAELANGKIVDVLQNGKPLDFRIPGTNHLMFQNQRWWMFYYHLANDEPPDQTPLWGVYRPLLSHYLCRRWNETHDSQEQIKKFELLRAYELDLKLNEIAPETLYTLRHGRWTLQDDQGRKTAQGNFDYDKKTGVWTYWHPNGKKSHQGEFHNGLEEGTWTFWDEQGRKEGQGQFKGGREDGRWQIWNEDGSVGFVYYRAGKEIPAPRQPVAP